MAAEPVDRGSEQVRRHELFESMRSVHGERPAGTLMELLPPVGWGDVATREHVSHECVLLRAEIHAEIAAVRSDLSGEIAAVRSDLHAEIGEVRSEMAQMRAQLEAKIDATADQLGKQLADALREQSERLSKDMRTLTVTLFATTVSLWVGTIAAFAAVR